MASHSQFWQYQLYKIQSIVDCDVGYVFLRRIVRVVEIVARMYLLIENSYAFLGVEESRYQNYFFN